MIVSIISFITCFVLHKIKIIYFKDKIKLYDFAPIFISSISCVFTHYLLYSNSDMFWNIYSFPVEQLPYYTYLVTMMLYGYSWYEIYLYTIDKRIEFLIHGVSMCVLFSHMYSLRSIHYIFPVCITETSSIFLSFKHHKNPNIFNDICFVITFFLYKSILVPYILIHSIMDHKNHLRLHISIYAIPFMALYLYWSIIILNKIRKKITHNS